VRRERRERAGVFETLRTGEPTGSLPHSNPFHLCSSAPLARRRRLNVSAEFFEKIRDDAGVMLAEGLVRSAGPAACGGALLLLATLLNAL